MQQLVDRVMSKIKDPNDTIREASIKSGIQMTRVFRLRNGAEPKLSELVKIANAYGVTLEGLVNEEIGAAREKARQEAWSEVWEKAEQKVAAKYGITPTAMEWRILDPKFTKAV